MAQTNRNTLGSHCRPPKNCYLDFKAITLIRSDCSITEPSPSTGCQRLLLEDARGVPEPPRLVADGQRATPEPCWLVPLQGGTRQCKTQLHFLSEQPRGSSSPAQSSTSHIDPGPCSSTWGTSPPKRATACSVGLWGHGEQPRATQ